MEGQPCSAVGMGNNGNLLSYNFASCLYKPLACIAINKKHKQPPSPLPTHGNFWVAGKQQKLSMSQANLFTHNTSYKQSLRPFKELLRVGLLSITGFFKH
jgi:hypothetical protein